MPRKKQKGPSARAHHAGGPPKPGPTPATSKPKNKGFKQDSKQGGVGKDANLKNQPIQANQRPIVPFLRGDRILLIGEGDFSFARSLAKQYKCRKLCATCYDSKETLLDKYPQAEQHIQDILETSKSSTANPKTVNPTTAKQDSTTQNQPPEHSPSSKPTGPKVLFSVDARKLGAAAGGGKDIRTGFPRKERKRPAWKVQTQPAPAPVPSGPWDVICFNFPHVGGLSTDVNRQVRSNQELLVAFFKACVPLLSAAPKPADSDDEWDEEEDDDESSGDEEDLDGEGEDAQTSGKAVREGPGQILVSLFEAEPYTLWNVKDLARHAGLQVVTSFRFPWASYEGYSHARTLGEVEGKSGGRGGWRGEDRDARMYVFEVKRQAEQTGKKKKRARENDSDSE